MRWLISRIMAFTCRNFLLSLKNFFAFTEILFWPVIGIVSIGIMASFLKLEPKYLYFLLTGAIIAGVLQVSQLDVAYGLLLDVWSKSVKQTFIAPVKIYDVIIGSWIMGIGRGILSFIILYLVSKWGFKFALPDAGLVVAAMAGVYLSSLIVGMCVLIFIFLFGQRIDIIAWMISVVMMLLCGIYYPVTYLPDFLVKIASVIPLTYFMEHFRTGYGFGLTFSHPLLKGFVLSFIYIIILYIIVNIAYTRARKTGMILKLSE